MENQERENLTIEERIKKGVVTVISFILLTAIIVAILLIPKCVQDSNEGVSGGNDVISGGGQDIVSPSCTHVEVVDEDEVDLDKISVGCTVTLYDNEFEEEVEYKIVGSTEANSLAGKISNESPLGVALLGKAIGDDITVETQFGVAEYKVLKIERSI